VARRRAKAEGWTLVEGSCSWAEPAGTVSRAAYEQLRDEVLGQLRAAMPVDGVVLGLHGAMVADGYDDCEGDLIERVRNIVGAAVPIGVELDPHCHMTQKRVRNATLIICFKEFPHTDFVARGEEVVELTLQAVRGQIKPVMSLCDCRMIGSFPTNIQPMRGFVDKMSALEGKVGVLSISAAHCFPYADVPEMGSRILVVTDNRREAGDKLARALADEFFAMRGKTLPDYHAPDIAIDKALQDPGPVVIADKSDNPGGGAAGDSTFVLRRMLERGVTNACLGPQGVPVWFRLLPYPGHALDHFGEVDLSGGLVVSPAGVVYWLRHGPPLS
jgi:microcystin degradation protein MlrC